MMALYKVIVRIGTTNGGELVWEPVIPKDLYLTYIALSIPNESDENVKELSIMRIPFSHHGKTGIHTMCQLNSDEIREIEMM